MENLSRYLRTDNFSPASPYRGVVEPNAGHPREEGLKVLKIEKERGFQLFRFNQRHGSGDLQSILYSHICSSMLFFDGQQEQETGK